MPFYQYTAKSLTGEVVKGKKQAASIKELAQLLKGEGCFLISADATHGKRSLKDFLPKIKHIPISQKLLVTQNLQVMIASGVSLPHSIEVLQKQTKNSYFKLVLGEIKELILKGSSLSKALSEFPDVFSDIYISLVRVGEKTGNLEGVLGILTGQLKRSYQLRSRIRGAMLYPLVVVSTMLLIGAAMIIKVVPQLEQTFEELEVELPLLTKIVIALGGFFADNWFFLLLFLIFFLIGSYVLLKKGVGKKQLHNLFLKVPILGPLVKKINTTYTALSLSALVQGGVSIVTALDIASDAVGNFYYKQALKKTAKKLEKGKKLSKLIAKYPNLYSPLFVQMLQVGEETGTTADMLLKLSEFYEEQVNNTTKNLSSIIEPVLLLLVGIAVGIFAVSVMQPIYSIMSSM